MSTRTEPIAVLHVDDPEFAGRTADALEREDERFAVETVTGADEALARLACAEFDCIVCDYEIPGADGLEVLEAVRADDPDLPFVLFTGDGSEAIAAEAIERGVTSYLRKEGDGAQFSELADRIRTHVEEYRADRGDRLEEEYRIVAEVATDVFWTLDVDTGDVAMNSGVEEFGYDPDAVDPDLEWWRERVHPGDRERMVAQQNAATSPGEEGFEEYSGDRGCFETEFRWQRADGSYAHVVGRGVTLFEEGEPEKQIGAMQDVTDRKRREEELDLFRELIDESNALVFINDAHTGELVYANQTACEELGYGRAELLEKSVHDIETAFEDRSDAVAHFEDVREQGRMRFEGEQQRKDGSTVPVEVNLAYVPLDTDYVVAIARNITDRLERERALEEQNERLERFASIVSHDLRNPLSVATGRLELAREDPTEEHFDGIETALARMERIVDDILYLTREGKDVGSQEPVDLAAAAETAWDVVPDTAEATLVVEGGLGSIRADRDRLLQLLENLFTNALEHGDETATVRVEATADGFAIEDDGPGIAPEERDAVFEDGYSTSDAGTGLGLSIVAEIARGHGWEVDLVGGEAGGARFEVSDVAVLE